MSAEFDYFFGLWAEDWILAPIFTAPVCVFESGYPPYLWARVLRAFVLQGRSRSVCSQEAQKARDKRRREQEAEGRGFRCSSEFVWSRSMQKVSATLQR